MRTLEKQDVDAVELKRKAKFRQTLTDARTAMICRLETEIDADMKAMLREQVKHLNRIARDPNFVPSPEPESTKRNATAWRKRKAV